MILVAVAALWLMILVGGAWILAPRKHRAETDYIVYKKPSRDGR